MGRALVVTRAFKQNITGGAFEALAAATDDSLAVPNFAPGSRAWLLEAWAADSANAADFDLRSPSFHDNTRGVRFAYQPKPAAGNPQLTLPGVIRQPLQPSDVLTAEVNGTATNNVGLNWLSYYENLPGADQRLLTWAEVEARMTTMVGIFVGPTAGAAGDYGASRALNADDDRLEANSDYALLGAVSQIACELVTITGPETSGRKIGIPLLVNEHISGSFFADLSAKYQLPLVPVFNANNKGNIIIKAADASGATVPHVTLIFGQLS